MLGESTYTDYTANTNLSTTKASFAGIHFLNALNLHLSFFTLQSWLVVNCSMQTYCRYVIAPISISKTPNFSHVNFVNNNGRRITSSFVLEQKSPNPINPSTWLKFKINKWSLFLPVACWFIYSNKENEFNKVVKKISLIIQEGR